MNGCEHPEHDEGEVLRRWLAGEWVPGLTIAAGRPVEPRPQQ